jgi:hypothetical protein
VLPFAVMAPGRFFDDVVKAQLVRTSARISLSYRIDQLAGLGWLHLGTFFSEIAAVIMMAAAAALTGAWLAARHKPPPLERFVVATAGLVAVAFLVPDDFYYHYGAFFGPFLALALALSAARLIGKPGWLRRVAAGAAALAVVVLPIAVPGAESVPESTYTAAIGALTRVIPPGACVVSDQASLLISAGRFVSSVPDCVPVIDGFGSSYALAGRAASASGANPAVAGLWKRAFKAAQYIVLTRYDPRRIAWAPALRAYLRGNFVYVSGPWPGLRLYARRPSSARR